MGPQSPHRVDRSRDFHVWLTPGTGQIEYRSDISGTLIHQATHHISSLRTRGHEPTEIPLIIKRILALGDSVTFGQGVNDRETLSVNSTSLLSS